MRMLRADLHVHTCHSRVTGRLRFLGSRDCYSAPADVYRVAKARGMDLVAITDHDSIDGALELVGLLGARPDAQDVIVGEEISCRLQEGNIEVHLGAYGMTEPIHRQVQSLRRNVFDVIACLREAGVFFALNHLLHFYRRQIPIDAYLRLLDEVPAVEARNGTMLTVHNRFIEQIAMRWSPRDAASRLGMVAGSDAHTLRRVGLTWTTAPGRTREEFLSSLKQGLGRPGGRHGTAATVAGDAYGVVASYIGSLAGLGPPDHRSWRRAGCLAFAVGSLPFQSLPFVFAVAGKLRERRAVDHACGYFAAAVESRAAVAAPLEPGA